MSVLNAPTPMRLDQAARPAPSHAVPDPSARPGDVDDPIPTRRCGRCREVFPGDSTLHPTALPEWWLCPPCRVALLGDRSSSGPAPVCGDETRAAGHAR
jgi:hypothetical protein